MEEETGLICYKNAKSMHMYRIKYAMTFREGYKTFINCEI